MSQPGRIAYDACTNSHRQSNFSTPLKLTCAVSHEDCGKHFLLPGFGMFRMFLKEVDLV